MALLHCYLRADLQAVLRPFRIKKPRESEARVCNRRLNGFGIVFVEEGIHFLDVLFFGDVDVGDLAI